MTSPTDPTSLESADTPAGRPTGAAPARPDTPPRPLVDLTAHTKAAQAIADRSRSEGVWSLGHLRICWLALGIGGGLLAIAGGFLGGLGAVLGVVLGTVIVGAFFTFSAVVIAWVGKTNPKTVMVAALFAYVIKVFVLAIVLMTMPIDGPVNVRWMAGAIGLGLFLSAGVGLAALLAGGSVLESWILDLHLPVVGDVHLVTSLFFDIAATRALVEPLLAKEPGSNYTTDIKPYVAPFDVLAGATSTKGDNATFMYVLTVTKPQ